MRIRTTVDPHQGYVLVDHIEHETTDIELAALYRVVAGALDGSPICWDEPLDRERRAAIIWSLSDRTCADVPWRFMAERALVGEPPRVRLNGHVTVSP